MTHLRQARAVVKARELLSPLHELYRFFKIGQNQRTAASACCASSCRVAKNSFDWPMKRPSSVRALTAPIAAPVVLVGRTMETGGNLRLRKMVGSGMIRLVWKSSPPKGGLLRSGKTSPLVGSVRAGALPALSCHVWKWAVSVGPMLSRMRSTSTLLTRWASEG